MGFFSFLDDRVRVFRDILVHPTQEMRDPDGAFFRVARSGRVSGPRYSPVTAGAPDQSRSIRSRCQLFPNGRISSRSCC
jgi:hypothetical protein